jgi:hypothetical protein
MHTAATERERAGNGMNRITFGHTQHGLEAPKQAHIGRFPEGCGQSSPIVAGERDWPRGNTIRHAGVIPSTRKV